MRPYLILRLSGPMQAWGQPTFEGTRPSASFPTRSGLLGLLGACLGIRREDRAALTALSDSVRFAVRCDPHSVNDRLVPISKLIDYHTVQDAREDYQGLKSHETIQTWREYLCDAHFTVAIWCAPDNAYDVGQVAAAVRKPHFTPYLGRRSCPLSHPLYLGQCEAQNPLQALDAFSFGGEVYSEEAIGSDNRRFRVRDDPIMSLPRQFAARDWFVIKGDSTCS
ncbi:type I-E CRISPR-associated protein Cas5/CasD [Acerihabitans sp. KWT182]|uniref:Type I-E CRISPR-associated protein Cas5/CasD n=1 Tax=Acerihabitans sp. KWT182 TaxID=3157919 RepID=A0AAU7QEC0_9GAMM